jgi:nitroreductase
MLRIFKLNARNSMDSNKSNANDGAQARISMLRGVRQVRQFTPEPVPQEAIDGILEVGRWSGSGRNAQPWDLVLVRDREKLKEIADGEGQGSHFGSATFGIIIVMEGEKSDIKSFDEGRLTERLMLAAAAYGVGAGIWWFRDGGAAAKRVLGIPEDRRVRTAISYGYADKEATASRPKRQDARKPLSELVHTDRW